MDISIIIYWAISAFQLIPSEYLFGFNCDFL
ncbi:MAG: hypothetical protein ACK504_03605 [Bacteroidota bacterium]